MKKMIAMMVAMMATSIAMAMSYVELFTAEYDEDTSPSTSKCANYSVYYCAKANAGTMFGGANTLSGIESYLTENFATGKSNMGSAADSYALTQGDYNIDQYQFSSHYAAQIAAGDYFAVAFYQDSAFRVFASADVDSGNLRFDDSDALTTAGEWQTVPEPTSALLMLLGMAGLVLKRRNV